MDYKKYSLEHLENWIHDAMNSDEISPKEIYDTICSVVDENHLYHQKNAEQAKELKSLLKGEKISTEYERMTAAGYEMTADGFWIKEPKEDKVVKWQLPVEVDGASGEYYVTFPDDLLDAANMKEGDTVEWIDRKDGSFEIRKVEQHLLMENC